ncbi:MAG: hypothetical protein J5861_04465 [Desulfovibrio sp.]|nr:hypothetical protein [Desulfovibrio sp.]
MAITAMEYLKASRDAKDLRVAQGAGPGPEYHGSDVAPLIWFDQFYGQGLTPTGTLDLTLFEPLRVGATQSSLDLVITASHGNTGTLLCPAGSSVKVELFQSDSEDGPFETSGYAVTMTNGAVRNVEPDVQICRLYIGNMSKAYMVPKITFTGAFAGGLVDVGLARSVR